MHNTHRLAQGLASLGRGEDSLLVHMTPGEVHGLQSLAVSHGKSLTINPHTGLPEAGVLASILPLVAGAAATFFSGGTLAPVVAGMAAGAIGSGAENKWNANSMLMGGLTGALGGMGGGALASGLGGAGAAAAGQAAAPAAAGAGQAAAAGAGQAAAGAAPASIGSLAAAPAAASGAPASIAAPAAAGAPSAAAAAPTAAEEAAKQAAAQKAGIATFQNTVGAGPKWDLAKQGMTAWGQHPLDTSQAMLANMSSGQKLGLATTGIGALQAASQSGGGGGGGKPDKPNWYMTSFDPRTQTYSPGQWTRDRNVIQNYLASNGQDMTDTSSPFVSSNPAKHMADGGMLPAQNSSIPGANATNSGQDVQVDPYSGNEVTMGDYFAEMARGAVNPNAMPAQPPTNQNQYLAGLTSLIHTPPPQLPRPAASTPAPASTTPATPTPTSSVFGNLTSAAIGDLGKRGALRSRNAAPTAVPNFNWNPDTQSFTKLAGGGSLNVFSQGRFLNGEGDGVSDSIPAEIHSPTGKQKAALADGEFVIDARTVSELGNGSSQAGAKKLYAMMDRVHKARRSAKLGKPSGADKALPA